MNYPPHPSLSISLLLHLEAAGFGSQGCSLRLLFDGFPLVLCPIPAFQSPVYQIWVQMFLGANPRQSLLGCHSFSCNPAQFPPCSNKMWNSLSRDLGCFPFSGLTRSVQGTLIPCRLDKRLLCVLKSLELPHRDSVPGKKAGTPLSSRALKGRT